MDSKNYFDQCYKNAKEYSYSKSLYTFFEAQVCSRLPENAKILDIGSGSYSFLEDVIDLKADVTAMDFSNEAIKKSPQSKITYVNSSVVEEKYFQDSTYDLVFDSHCMNCITLESEREIVFTNIYRSLKPDGLFASELMVNPIDKKVFMPFKIIKSSLELEQEIISHGFKIIYFMISKDDIFSTVVDGVEVNCDVLRVIARK